MKAIGMWQFHEINGKFPYDVSIFQMKLRYTAVYKVIDFIQKSHVVNKISNDEELS